jgi:thioredoxin 1
MTKKILYFSATWCKPCQMMKANLSKVEIDTPIEHIDIDQDTETPMKFAVRSVPTLVLLENDQEVKRLMGVKPASELATWANA